MSGAGQVLRILTWNVHGCIGRDRICSPERIADVLAEVDPDISALQEIDARLALPGIDDPFTFFASRLRRSSLAAKTISSVQGQYGHLLMSRWPLQSLGIEDLSVPRHEPRQALLAAAASPFGKLGLVAAHLGLTPFERRRQLTRLKRVVASFGRRPVVALGDFNDLRRHGAAEKILCPPLRPAPCLATFPAAFPLLPLDRIWCSAQLEILSVSTLPHAHRMSDHLPLLAKLRVRPTSAPVEEPETPELDERPPFKS